MGPITIGSVKANGLDVGYLAAGPARGPLALLLHGFPDSPHTWRHLMPALVAAGYRAVAPFMRGYAPTSIPDDGAYQIGALAADANALHDVLGGGSDAVLVGHDWGALAVYGAAGHAPGRWRRAVTMAVPPAPVTAAALLGYEQLKRSFYMFVLQTPLGEAVVGRGFVEALWRDWSPAGSGGHARDVDHAMDCLAAPANVAAAIGYYRAMFDTSRHSGRYAAEQQAVSVRGEVPVLYLHGAEDGCLALDAVAPGGDFGGVLAALPPASRAALVPGAGHFVQLDRPADVNGLVLGWLR